MKTARSARVARAATTTRTWAAVGALVLAAACTEPRHTPAFTLGDADLADAGGSDAGSSGSDAARALGDAPGADTASLSDAPVSPDGAPDGLPASDGAAPVDSPASPDTLPAPDGADAPLPADAALPDAPADTPAPPPDSAPDLAADVAPPVDTPVPPADTAPPDVAVDTPPPDLAPDLAPDVSPDLAPDVPPPECTAPATRCALQGEATETCVAGRWTPGTTCQYVCRNNGCTGQCVPTKQRCNGKMPQTCNADGVWSDDRATACQYVCHPTTFMCTGVCTPELRQCKNDNLTPQVCTALGQWQDADACSGNTPECTGAGACTCSRTMCPSACTDVATDKNNCGTCGRSCGGGSCVSSACKKFTLPLNEGAANVRSLHVAGAWLYWSERLSGDDSGRVRRVSVTGGTTQTIANTVYAGALTYHNNILYWSQMGGIYRKNPDTNDPPAQLLHGGNPLPIVSYTSPLLVVNNKLCYGAESITYANLDGSAVALLEGIPEGYSVTCDDTHSYYSIQPEILRVKLAGGEPGGSYYTVTGAGEVVPDVSVMMPSGGYVYYGTGWQNGGQEAFVGRVSTTSNTDQAQKLVLANGAVNFVHKTANDPFVYFVATETDSQGSGCTTTIGKIAANNLSGGNVVVLDTSTTCPKEFGHVTADDIAIYWTDGTTLMKIAK
jgi:hypothetical protein